MEYRQLPRGNSLERLSVLGPGIGGIQNRLEAEMAANHYDKLTVSATVFGGGRHTWRLQLAMSAVKRAVHWYFTGAKASTY